jgi:hypothetical protein
MTECKRSSVHASLILLTTFTQWGGLSYLTWTELHRLVTANKSSRATVIGHVNKNGVHIQHNALLKYLHNNILLIVNQDPAVRQRSVSMMIPRNSTLGMEMSTTVYPCEVNFLPDQNDAILYAKWDTTEIDEAILLNVSESFAGGGDALSMIGDQGCDDPRLDLMFVLEFPWSRCSGVIGCRDALIRILEGEGGLQHVLYYDAHKVRLTWQRIEDAPETVTLDDSNDDEQDIA